jgi:putative oxidoreductase
VSRLRHPLLHAALGLLLGALFVYASLDKIAKPADFARIIYHYQLIGPNQHVGPLPANLLAVTLPFVEIVAGLLLITGLWRREAALVTAGMLVVFILAVSASLVRGIDVENCGCFTVSGAGRAAGMKLILQDVGMLAAALVLLLVPPPKAAGEAGAQASQSPV